MKNIKQIMVIVTGVVFMMLFSACEKFVDIGPPRNSLVPETVFKNDDLATSALLGIYGNMAQNGYASGDFNSIATLTGVTGDELMGYDINLRAAYDFQLTPEVSVSNGTWISLYKQIYSINSILEGLESSTGLSEKVKEQIKGEALFLRAFHYFYLTNLFGPVPLNTKSNYIVNSTSFRKPLSEINDQILSDLKTSESLLSDSYVTTERVRPNRFAVRALLARFYLYKGDWENAEKYSQLIIEQANVYKLTGLNDVFLSNSLESIWQLMPTAGSNTSAGLLLILTTTPTLVSLRPDFATQAFEVNDLRKSNWVKSILSGGVTYYYPFKYKVKNSTTITEYYMIFRLAEQILIRAEARAMKNNLLAAIDDIDLIRNRAGLPLIRNTNPNITKSDLLTVIQKERRVELFSEWGDRWFDLKRRGVSDNILSAIKLSWKPEYILYPIPKAEIDNNRNITQNPGY